MEEITSFFKGGFANFFTKIGDWAIEFAINILISILVYIVGRIVISWFVNKFLDKILKKTKIDVDVHRFIKTTVKVVLYIVLFLGIIGILGFQTSSLIALLGSAGLAVAMSLQGSLSNFAGGLLLLIFKPFKKGDYISANGVEGEVIAVSMLYTKLKTIDSRGVSLPNGKLANSEITNYHSEPVRRIDIEFVVSYDYNLKELKDLMVEAMSQNEYVLKDQPLNTVIKSLDANGIRIANTSYCLPEKYWPAFFRMNELIDNQIVKHNIKLRVDEVNVNLNNVNEKDSDSGSKQEKKIGRKNNDIIESDYIK